ncbi:MAG: Gfo/Idh/MocA family oxidoreductase [Verrucomicrobiales bacterium]|nr:Gfo/Idh/MocA family oxidoreductase [Verrucomicrobiales bacterium]
MTRSEQNPSFPRTDRRKFLGVTAGAAASTNLLSGYLAAQGESKSAGGKLNIAFIGAGGRANANIQGCAKTGHNVYALCDVDQARAGGSYKKYPNAKRYTDWREMLEVEGDAIDAVVISTPDHLHAVSAMAAIQMGKHVYVEKPLTLTISEARALHAAAKEKGVCTQMGNTGHAAEGARRTNEFIQSGSIGEVEQVYCRTNRPIWPQDLVRPAAEGVPETLDWDLWLGPAPEKPFSSKIAPFKWRGFLDYGTGALGDMGAHIIDHPMWALGLGLPTKVSVEKADRSTPGAEKDSHPSSCIINYEFAATENHGPVKLQWLDGKYKIPTPAGMRGDKKVPDNGCVYLGSEHTIMHGSHGGAPTVIDANHSAHKAPEKTEERSPGHYQEWIDAIQKNDPSLAKSNFDVAVPLTETLLLGVIGSLLGPGTELTWDAEKMTTGNADADALVFHNYRDGWSL